MNIMKSVATLCAVALCLASCEKEFTLSVEETAVVFSSGSVRQQLTVKSNGRWSVGNGPDWVTFSPASGSGDETVEVLLDEDLKGLNLSGTAVVSGDGKEVSITIAQKGADFIVTPEAIEFDEDGTPVTLSVLSATDWTLDIPSSIFWLSADRESGGRGNTTVTLTPTPITDRTPRTVDFVTIDYGKSFSMISVSQKLPNQPPTAPVLLSPADADGDVAINAGFTWEASTDPDGDGISYSLMISKDGGQSWSSTQHTKTYGRPAQFLDVNTDYKWKVVAVDSFEAGSESEVRSFHTNESGAYADGQVTLVQAESAGAPKAIPLVFLGDGFIADDYAYGGAFDQAVETAVEAFFSLEPFKTYRNYFRISTVATYSQERGATVLNAMSNQPVQSHNTAFSATLEGGNSTGTSCDYEKALSVASTVDGLAAQVRNTTVILLINIDAYAGTCLMYSDGRSVSMCPMGKSSFTNVVMHEAGGHGFGRLLDEYRYYNEPLPADRKSSITSWRSQDEYYGYNISLTGDRSAVHWKQYFTMSGYDAVDLFEGGCLYYTGVWRPEKISCMEDNRPYYNAPSREAIVRRIYKASGKTFSMSEFVSKDKEKSDPSTKADFTPVGFVPLAPPILIEVPAGSGE